MTTPLTPDELAALRERHVEADGECRSWRCNGLWPCMTARLLATLDAQTLDVERLRRLAEAAAVLAIEAEARAAVIAEVRAAVEGLDSACHDYEGLSCDDDWKGSCGLLDATEVVAILDRLVTR